MKRTLQLLAVLMMGGFMTLTSARAQVSYPTPYTFTTIAGTAGNPGSAPGMNGAGLFYYPEGVAVDTTDNLYVVDNFENIVRKVHPTGGTNWSVSTIAGTAGVTGSSDGTGPSAKFSEPSSIAIDSSNHLYVADSLNDTVRRLTSTGDNSSWAVVTIAGTAGSAGPADGTNSAAQFNNPSGIAVDAAGNLYVADTDNQTIRRVVPVGTNGVVTTIAGTAGHSGPADGTNQVAQFFLPSSIAVDRSGNLYVADSGNNTIREIVPMGTNWVVTTIAGTAGNPGYTDGTNTDSQFDFPSGITVDANGNLYVADTFNNAIREISPVGTNWVTITLAGDPDGNPGTSNGTGPTALFNNPFGIAADVAGNLFVSDTVNNTMREAPTVPNPTIALAAGNSVVVSWPGPVGTPQTNANLAASNWGTYGGTVSSNNGTNSVTIAPVAGSLFFRLTRP